MTAFQFYAVTAAAFSCLVAATISAAPPLFDAPWRAFEAGRFSQNQPVHMAYGDLDGDGDIDVVTARHQFGQPGMGVMLNNGDGTFAQPTLYDVPFNYVVWEVALVDFDSNGTLDVFATAGGQYGAWQYNRVYLWRGNGDGTFASPTFFTTGTGCVGMTVGDFTGDGFPDVVTANHNYYVHNTISLLKHNGQTGAAAALLLPVHTVVANHVYRVDSADIDNDGDLDLAVGRNETFGVNIATLLNDGAGNFGSITSLQELFLAAPDQNVHFADVNNDGYVDLLTSGRLNWTPTVGVVAVRLNLGGSGGTPGTFASPVEKQLGPWSWTNSSIRTADLNNDGWLDIVTVSPMTRERESFHVLMNDNGSGGGGGAGGFLPDVMYHAAKDTKDAALFDADGDGDIDIIGAAADSSVISVHRNLGSGVFPKAVAWTLGSVVNGADWADVDGDGDADVVAAGGLYSGGEIYRMRNQGNGTFAAVQMQTAPFAAGDIKLRDFNNDGLPDLLLGPLSTAPPYRVAMAINQGNGVFGTPVVFNPGACQAGNVEAFDFDNDGDLDVALTDPGGCFDLIKHIFLFRNNFIENGQAPSFTQMPTVEEGGYGIAGGDFDHDGNIDLIVGMALFRGHGDFTFDSSVPVAPGVESFRFDVGDVNGDGHLDVAWMGVQGPSTWNVGRVLGYGNGNFGQPQSVFAATGLEATFQVLSDVDVVDFNGDGRGDVFVTSNACNDVTVFTTNADGTLSAIGDRYGTGYNSRYTAIKDLTGDGVLDIGTIAYIPSPTGDSVVVVPGLSDPTPHVIGDITGDGVVNVNDMLAVINSWGACGGGSCPADIAPAPNGDGVVNVNDLLMVIHNWI